MNLPKDEPTTDPSKGPTAAPSKEQDPTADPTKEPTASPSKEQEPTADPTKEPTVSPTKEQEPTEDPSKGSTSPPSREREPTVDPTKEPQTDSRNLQEDEPTADPSKEPTVSPTKEQEPTEDPTKEPTVSPTKEQEPTGDPSKGPTSPPSREREPTADPTKEPAESPSKETEPTAAPSKRQEPTTSLSGVQGYSSLPIDRVLPGVPCFGSLESAANKCYVIEGGSRIYMTERVTFQEIRDGVVDDIKAAMESGAFNHLEGRIVGLTYLENVTIDEDPDTPSDNTSSASETLPAWAWGIIGAGAFMVLAMCGYLCTHRRREDKGKGSDEMTPLGDHGVDYAPPPPASDHDNPYYDQVPLPQDSTEALPQDYNPEYSSRSDLNEPEYCPPPALDDILQATRTMKHRSTVIRETRL